MNRRYYRLFVNTKYTQLRVKRETRDLLAQRGTYDDTFDSIIDKLLKENNG